MNGRDLQMQQMQGAQAQQDACSARALASGTAVNATALESPKLREVRRAAVALKAAREAHRIANVVFDAAHKSREQAEDEAASAEQSWRKAVEELRKELEAAEPA